MTSIPRLLKAGHFGSRRRQHKDVKGKKSVYLLSSVCTYARGSEPQYGNGKVLPAPDESNIPLPDVCFPCTLKVQSFVIDLLHSIRERGIDSKTSYVVFIGGGAVLLKRFIEKTERLSQYMFIEDLRANAVGYGILYQMTKTEE